MAFVHGSKAVLKIADDVSGTGVLRDISDALSESAGEQSVDTAEVTAFGNTAKAYIAGLEDGNLTFSGHYTNTAQKVHQVLSAIKRKVIAFEFFPAGEVSGEAKQAGDCILTSYTVNSTVTGAVSVSGTFQITGGITDSTVA